MVKALEFFREIKFSKHARDRMSERGISVENVLDTLNNPVQHVYDKWRDLYIAVSEQGYAVVYAYRGNTVEVVTVLGRREYEALLSKYGFKRYKLLD